MKRDEALPYIMGANITTLADTLVVAMLQKTPVAAQIVLAEAIGVTHRVDQDPRVLLRAHEAIGARRSMTGWSRTTGASPDSSARCSLVPLVALGSGLVWRLEPDLEPLERQDGVSTSTGTGAAAARNRSPSDTAPTTKP